ncbi:MAG: transcription-repair coupling factor [Clostridiales bacterium]|jgi:transcription-repair coupling factor (superfamily II helicase)|nr:transcription-repair coupling factor [Clostridiales bacterium]
MIDVSGYLKLSGTLAELAAAHRDKKNISVFSLHLGERAVVSGLLADGGDDGKSPLVYVCADYVAARKAFGLFSCFDGPVVFLGERNDVLAGRKFAAGEAAHNRAAALKAVACDNPKIVVTTVDALVQTYPDPAAFKDRTYVFTASDEYPLADLAARFTDAGYEREDQVTAKGRFSLRGDILDIWPPDRETGVRMEFFGDLLESIRLFEPDGQTAGESVGSVVIAPCTELFDGTERVGFYEFVSPARVVYDEAKRVADNAAALYTEYANRRRSGGGAGENPFVPRGAAFKFPCPQLAFHTLAVQNPIFTPDAVFSFNSVSLPAYNRDYQKLYDDISAWLSNGFTVVLFCGSEAAKNNFRNYFAEQGGFGPAVGGLVFRSDVLDESAVFFEQKTILIGTYNLVLKTPPRTVRRKKGDVFVEPAVGGYVVHNVHGVGFCEAVRRLELNGASRDYFEVAYEGGDKLYVPIENMDSLTRLVSGGENPKLSKIGGADFARVKAKVKSSVKLMAAELLGLYAARKEARGHKYAAPDAFFNEFCDAFPFEETPDQLDAVEEGLRDLTDGRIMDRLLCGDVGYGKTEVALRLAFKVITEGKQAAFVSPTTILARQHYNTVKARMEPFGVRVGSLTRFDSAADIKKTLALLAAGDIDIVVGTHRALSSDVIFKDLGFLILDEEQRFGVRDKEKIKRIKTNVNVLTLSATPIPRTLHMSLSGIRDISVLDTPPAMRIPVQTYVTELTDALITDAVSREVNRGGQAFIVYNRVETIEKFAARVRGLLPSLRVSVAHGQMNESALEDAVANFADGGADVLVCTTIIENGIDMPRANTMLVVDSDRFGLSQLYQLRGRVGRAERLAYVYFTFDGRKILTEDAYKRLDAITEYTEFGSGFKIAMRDLEIRGAGNVLGREQHGHIEKVGYDMYCKLLESAVKELAGEPDAAADRPEVKVYTDFNAFIPEGYIRDPDWRMRVYSRVSAVKTNADRLKLQKDLEDIYGKIPAPAENLLTVALVKNLAAAINAVSVTLKRRECSVKFARVADLPPAAARLAASKLDATSGKIDFGPDRSALIRYLLAAAKA